MVAVAGARALDEAVVEVVVDGARQHAIEPEDVRLLVELVLVARPARDLDDDLDDVGKGGRSLMPDAPSPGVREMRGGPPPGRDRAVDAHHRIVSAMVSRAAGRRAQLRSDRETSTERALASRKSRRPPSATDPGDHRRGRSPGEPPDHRRRANLRRGWSPVISSIRAAVSRCSPRPTSGATWLRSVRRARGRSPRATSRTSTHGDHASGRCRRGPTPRGASRSVLVRVARRSVPGWTVTRGSPAASSSRPTIAAST